MRNKWFCMVILVLLFSPQLLKAQPGDRIFHESANAPIFPIWTSENGKLGVRVFPADERNPIRVEVLKKEQKEWVFEWSFPLEGRFLPDWMAVSNNGKYLASYNYSGLETLGLVSIYDGSGTLRHSFDSSSMLSKTELLIMESYKGPVLLASDEVGHDFSGIFFIDESLGNLVVKITHHNFLEKSPPFFSDFNFDLGSGEMFRDKPVLIPLQVVRATLGNSTDRPHEMGSKNKKSKKVYGNCDEKEWSAARKILQPEFVNYHLKDLQLPENHRVVRVVGAPVNFNLEINAGEEGDSLCISFQHGLNVEFVWPELTQAVLDWILSLPNDSWRDDGGRVLISLAYQQGYYFPCKDSHGGTEDLGAMLLATRRKPIETLINSKDFDYGCPEEYGFQIDDDGTVVPMSTK